MPFTGLVNGTIGKSKAINVGEARKKGDQLQFSSVDQKRLVEMHRIYMEKLRRALRRDISLISAELERYVSSHLAAVVFVCAVTGPTIPPAGLNPPPAPNQPPPGAVQSTVTTEEYIPANHYVRSIGEIRIIDSLIVPISVSIAPKNDEFDQS